MKAKSTWVTGGMLAGLALVIAIVSGGLPGFPPAASDPASDPASVPPSVPGPANDPPVGGSTALDLLATVPIKGKAAKTGYDRTGAFGTAWLDVDRNGCDTRNDILTRDLTSIAKSGPCKVVSGTLVSPYTGDTIAFVRGNDTSTLVQIDHVVALSNAWQTGAQQLTQAERISLANDPLNLMAVDGRSNAQKSDGDTATWLPANKANRCGYVARQVSVKATYGLWIAQAEHDAMARVLGDCPTEPAMTSPLSPVTAEAPAPAPAPVPVPAQEPAPAPAPTEPVPAQEVFYADCDAVRAAGAAPISIGSPGYSTHLDRDKDGVGCDR